MNSIYAEWTARLLLLAAVAVIIWTIYDGLGLLGVGIALVIIMTGLAAWLVWGVRWDDPDYWRDQDEDE